MGLMMHGPLPRSVEAIVEQQVRAWRAKNRVERTRHEAAPRVVTVSREFGAGGARIARQVAEALGFTLWDHEFITHVAERAGADPRFVEAIDERQRDLLDDVIASSLLRGTISGTGYRMLLARTVAELATHGAAVIVGRGANFFVRAEQALRVRGICPLELRIQRYAAREGTSLAEAERLVLAKDRERARFVRQLCDEDAANPLHYDLLVNTGEIGEDQSAALVIDAYAARFGTVDLAMRGAFALEASP
jgi:cytidylate kinase